MITLIYSLIKFGAFLDLLPWILFWVVSLILYFVIFSMIKVNRIKGIKSIVLGFVCVEIIFDILWLILCGFNHWYLEYGVGITYGFFVWSIMLFVCGVITTAKNRITKNKWRE